MQSPATTLGPSFLWVPLYFWTLVALAVPGSLPVQGALYDANGAPLEGSYTLLFHLDDGDGSTYEEPVVVDLRAGAFAADLGVNTGVPDSLLDGPSLTVSVAVDGGPPSSPIPVDPVAFARRAQVADDADALGGEPASSWMLRADAWTAGDGLRLDGQMLSVDDTWSGAGWLRASDLAAAPPLTWTGTSVSAPEATPTQAGFMAAADKVALNQLSATVAAQGASLTALQGAVSTSGGQTTIHGTAFSSGGVRFPMLTAPTLPCTSAAHAGWTYFDTGLGALRMCDGARWIRFVPIYQDGTSQDRAAASCKQILDSGFSTGSATYWVDPNGGATTDAFQVRCDMSTDGGPSWA